MIPTSVRIGSCLKSQSLCNKVLSSEFSLSLSPPLSLPSHPPLSLQIENIRHPLVNHPGVVMQATYQNSINRISSDYRAKKVAVDTKVLGDNSTVTHTYRIIEDFSQVIPVSTSCSDFVLPSCRVLRTQKLRSLYYGPQSCQRFYMPFEAWSRS